MTNLLFVYGTLRPSSGHGMAQRLAGLARHVGPARIAGRLYDLGRFPGLLEPLSSDDWVQGDVYDLGAHLDQTLREMDEYEDSESGRTDFFDRQRASVITPEGTALDVWVYWFRGSVGEDRRITSGSYPPGA